MNYYILSYRGGKHGESGEPCGTEYSFDNACHACGAGAEVKGSLKVRGIAKAKNDLFETKNNDVLISKSLYERVKIKLAEFELAQVVDTRNQPLDFYHLFTNKTLPKFKKSSTGYVTEGQCSFCHRDGYFNDVTVGDALVGTPAIVKPVILRYEYEDVNKLSNALILKSWECVGLSNKVKHGNRVIGFARPWMLVVREVLKGMLEDERIRHIHFEHMILEGCAQQNL